MRSRLILAGTLFTLGPWLVAGGIGGTASSKPTSAVETRTATTSFATIAASAPSVFEATSLIVPLRVTVPARFPATPTTETATLLAWDAGEGQPAVRFLVPTGVYRPGETTMSSVPDDYLAYLLSQTNYGATFTDQMNTTVDGRTATVVTTTVSAPLDGSLGCPAAGITAADCFGLQPELTLRIAVVDVGATTLLIWWRHAGGVEGGADAFASFETMLASVELGDVRPASTAPSTPGGSTALDGTWKTTFEREALATSPLLEDPEEINDQNWGDLVLTFGDGRFTYQQSNPKDSYTATGTFAIDGDALTLALDNTERFAVRWHIDGDELVLDRDPTLGSVPTPYVLQPWTRAS